MVRLESEPLDLESSTRPLSNCTLPQMRCHKRTIIIIVKKKSQHAYNQSLHLYQMFPSTASSEACFLTDFWAIFRSLHHFLCLDNIEKFKKNLSKVLNTFENIMEN